MAKAKAADAAMTMIDMSLLNPGFLQLLLGTIPFTTQNAARTSYSMTSSAVMALCAKAGDALNIQIPAKAVQVSASSGAESCRRALIPRPPMLITSFSCGMAMQGDCSGRNKRQSVAVQLPTRCVRPGGVVPLSQSALL